MILQEMMGRVSPAKDKKDATTMPPRKGMTEDTEE